MILLSKKKLEVNEHWNEIVEALENKSIINVKVVKQVNGGVIAAYKEVSGFIPLSQLSNKYVENAEEFIGQTSVHCRRFPTAASRRSLGRVSVPVWPITLSGRLCIVALVSRYPTN